MSYAINLIEAIHQALSLRPQSANLDPKSLAAHYKVDESSILAHPAICTERSGLNQVSYADLQGRVYALAYEVANLRKRGISRIAILGYRSIEAYQSVLATLLNNITYVPLNPRYPLERTAMMLNDSASEAIIVCPECEDYFDKLKEQFDFSKVHVLSSVEGNTVINFNAKENSFALDVEFNGDATIYIIYTSGTTGAAKGVAISYTQFYGYMKSILDVYQYQETDIFSQMPELTFDLSLQDLLSALMSGGTLVTIPKSMLFCPVPIIERFKITIFHAVPSVVSYLKKYELLVPGQCPSVRMGIFVGEPLWYEQVAFFCEGCPNAKVFNTYGPTETTVIMLVHKVVDPSEGQPAAVACYENGQLRNEVVSLGVSLPTGAVMVADENGHELPCDSVGEIYLGGEQLGQGYFRREEKTREVFVTVDGTPWYKTGDRGVCRMVDGKKLTFFKGRIDDEVKLNGFRVSLLEIDEKLRAVAPCQAVAIPIERISDHIKVVYGAVESEDESLCESVRNDVKSRLPFYMVPEKIYALGTFPTNNNGKLDRKALKALVLERLNSGLASPQFA